MTIVYGVARKGVVAFVRLRQLLRLGLLWRELVACAREIQVQVAVQHGRCRQQTTEHGSGEPTAENILQFVV